jgi:hypothetical protein
MTDVASNRIRRGRALLPILALCAALLVGATPVSAAPADPYYGPHSGNFGVHTLIDDRHGNNGVTCVYAPNHDLHKLKIRRPIVFAYDRTAGVDTQWVGWRYVVEYIDLTTAGANYENWADKVRSTWVKAKATDSSAASWSPRSYTFGSEVADHFTYRVSVQIKWYYPYPSKTHVDGSATDVVQWYQVQSPVYPTYTTEGRCHKDDL